MLITIIIGSQQYDSQSSKVAWVISDKLKWLGHQTQVFDLGKNQLPYYTDTLNPDTDDWKQIRTDYQTMLHQSDWFVIISPERWGMVPWALKNFFLRCDDGELAHKPWLIVMVSSWTWWAYPVAELRMSSYKNTKICYIPDHVIVRHVNDVLNWETSEDDTRIQKRIDSSIEIFLAYCEWLKQVRQNQTVIATSQHSGM